MAASYDHQCQWDQVAGLEVQPPLVLEVEMPSSLFQLNHMTLAVAMAVHAIGGGTPDDFEMAGLASTAALSASALNWTRLPSQRTLEATWSLFSTSAVEVQEEAAVEGDHLKEEAAHPVWPQFYSNAGYEKN